MNSDLINHNLTLRLAFNFRHDITFLCVLVLHKMLTTAMCSVIKKDYFFRIKLNTFSECCCFEEAKAHVNKSSKLKKLFFRKSVLSLHFEIIQNLWNLLHC